ncbi:hypothetical protein ACFCX0_28940 [Streptomyces sp. NPDC056352]|uniref:hypothetical protein n=1 Tax=Streptomyces sp. NPDC056352 TaxID=3345791 RepID=UPI0035D5F3EE
MTHTPGAVTAAARRGLGAVVLVALLALLHAAFTSSTSHLSALDLDDCLRRSAAAASAPSCDTSAGAAVLDTRDGGHHHDGGPQLCDASVGGPRKVPGHGGVAMAPGGASSSSVAPAEHAGLHEPADAPRGLGRCAGSAVLRC